MDFMDTAALMISDDYKDRFRAEYIQTSLRLERLKCMLERLDDGELDFTPTCPRPLLNLQVKAMTDYLDVLEQRARLEGIDGLDC